jgi:glycosyltransferase involved in cell wall biosynthesis
MKIFIGLAEVSGYYAALKKGFDALGIESIHVALQKHRFKYDDDKKLPLIYKFARYCVTERVNKIEIENRDNIIWSGLVFISRFFLFFWALIKYDVFLLSCGSSFFKFKEFPILKFFGKKIIYTFHGTDSRPGYIDGFALDLSNVTGTDIEESIVDQYINITHQTWKNVKTVEKYADVIIQNIPTSIFHKRHFIPFLIVGIPAYPNSGLIVNENLSNQAKNGTVRILHSPSHHLGKGTENIRNAIHSLINKGHQIEYIEISEKPNAEVLTEINRSDFIVDQLYSATPMAGFVTEAAILGKPAVVGGYYCKYINEDLGLEYIPPSHFCDPDEIESGIERLILDHEYRNELGEKARIFVRDKWNAKSVAMRYLNLINNTFPKEWLYDPNKLEYIYGGGMPKNKARIIIRSIIKTRGKNTLYLKDKPLLEQKFIDFAFGKDEL